MKKLYLEARASPNTLPDMTPEQEIKQKFRDAGISVTQWASSHGYTPSVVYAVLSGKRKCYRGQSRSVAIALGLMPERSTFEEINIEVGNK